MILFPIHCFGNVGALKTWSPLMVLYAFDGDKVKGEERINQKKKRRQRRTAKKNLEQEILLETRRGSGA